MEKIKRFLWDIYVNNICNSTFIHPRFRHYLYRIIGMNVEKSRIRCGVIFDGYNIEIKENVFINRNAYFDCTEKVTIGRNTFIAIDVLVLTTTHKIGNKDKRAGIEKHIPVEIGDGCWIGARTTLLPGVKIGHGCIIGAGSLVNKNCEPNGMYAGVPAKKIRNLD